MPGPRPSHNHPYTIHNRAGHVRPLPPNNPKGTFFSSTVSVVAEFYSWFILLSNEKNEPFGLLFFINPSVTSCHLPYILRCKTQRRRLIVTLRSLQCDTPAYGARQGEKVEY